MITTIAIVLLSISCILLAREILKLKKRIETLHKETNDRISVTDQQTHLRINDDLLELNQYIVDTASNQRKDTAEKLEKITKAIIEKIPPTNETLLKEVQQMREDFLALRQNF